MEQHSHSQHIRNHRVVAGVVVAMEHSWHSHRKHLSNHRVR